MQQAHGLTLGLFSLAIIAYASPLPQNAGQPLFSVVSHGSNTIDANSASTTTTAARSSPSQKSNPNESPYPAFNSDVYSKGPSDAPPVTVSYDNSTGKVTVEFENQRDVSTKETKSGEQFGHDHHEKNGTKCNHHHGNNETLHDDHVRYDRVKNATKCDDHYGKNETTEPEAHQTASAPAAAASGFRTVSYIGVDGKKHEAKIYSRSLTSDIRDEEEAEQKQKASYLSPLNTPSKHQSSLPAAPEDREIRDLGKSQGTPSYLNPLNTPAKSQRSSSLEPVDSDIRDLGERHDTPSYMNALNTPSKHSIDDVSQGSRSGLGKRKFSKCVMMAGSILCKKAASDKREDHDDYTAASYLDKLDTPMEMKLESSMLDKRSEAGKCKWYHLGSVTVCAWMTS